MSGEDKEVRRTTLNLLVDALTDAEIEDYTADPVEHREAVERLGDRVLELEGRVSDLEAQLPGNGRKGKITAVLRNAVNKRAGNQPAVKMNAKEIRAATGVSERYSHTLTHPEDGLPGDRSWVVAGTDWDQYGSLELDQSDERKIVVDIEGVQSPGAPVSRLITEPENNPASDATQEEEV